jgi:CTP:molybdopterin cytidylyltransferase MocA
MFSSIVCAAKWRGWDNGLSAWVIALGDQPHLRPATLRALLAFHGRQADAISQPAFGGRRFHPVVLPRAALAELRRSRAPTLKEFLRHTEVPVLACEIEDPGLALDLDHAADYRKLSPAGQQ